MSEESYINFKPPEFEGIKNQVAHFINDGLPQDTRLDRLNKIAIQQMQILTDGSRIKMLEGNSNE